VSLLEPACPAAARVLCRISDFFHRDCNSLPDIFNLLEVKLFVE
jgi:hypothetical protein